MAQCPPELEDSFLQQIQKGGCTPNISSEVFGGVRDFPLDIIENKNCFSEEVKRHALFRSAEAQDLVLGRESRYHLLGLIVESFPDATSFSWSGYSEKTLRMVKQIEAVPLSFEEGKLGYVGTSFLYTQRPIFLARWMRKLDHRSDHFRFVEGQFEELLIHEKAIFLSELDKMHLTALRNEFYKRFQAHLRSYLSLSEYPKSDMEHYFDHIVGAIDGSDIPLLKDLFRFAFNFIRNNPNYQTYQYPPPESRTYFGTEMFKRLIARSEGNSDLLMPLLQEVAYLANDLGGGELWKLPLNAQLLMQVLVNVYNLKGLAPQVKAETTRIAVRIFELSEKNFLRTSDPERHLKELRKIGAQIATF
jgi:hypothetical protein